MGSDLEGDGGTRSFQVLVGKDMPSKGFPYGGFGNLSPNNSRATQTSKAQNLKTVNPQLTSNLNHFHPQVAFAMLYLETLSCVPLKDPDAWAIDDRDDDLGYEAPARLHHRLLAVPHTSMQAEGGVIANRA